MKKMLPFILMLCIARLAFTQVVPNGGFEDWSGGEPVGWRTYNNLKVTVQQTGIANSGDYAAMGDVDTLGVNLVSPFLLSDSIGGKYGFPVSGKYDALEFFYRLITDSGDVMPVIVSLYDSLGGIVGIGGVTYVPAYNYTRALVTIYYNSNPIPPSRGFISLTISDSLNKGKPHPGSFYIVDDMDLVHITGINQVENDFRFKTYPNPATGVLTVSYTLPQASAEEISMADMAGRVIYTQAYPQQAGGLQNKFIDISGFAPGIYLVTVRTSTGMASKRVVVGQ